MFVGGWASVTNAWVISFKFIISCLRNRLEYYKDLYTFFVNEILIKVLLYVKIGWSSHRNWERTFSDRHSAQQTLSKGINKQYLSTVQTCYKASWPSNILDFKNVLCFKEQMKWKAASIHLPPTHTVTKQFIFYFLNKGHYTGFLLPSFPFCSHEHIFGQWERVPR